MVEAKIPMAQVVTCDDVTPMMGLAETPRYYVAEQEKLATLRNLNVFPDGICEAFRQSCADFQMRYWIIDNSGSMSRSDGQRLVTRNGATRRVRSSRWEELGDSLIFHATLAASLGAPTEFRLLNAPAGCPQVVELGMGYKDAEIEQVRAMVATSPVGGTPLCGRIREVVQLVRAREPQLRAAGKRALIVIASDGEPSDGDVRAALQPFKHLPATIVVRLCTDEDKIVDFWSDVDADLEFPLDVLDDVVSEATEVHTHNPWLTYGLPLHRLREFGCASAVVDLLDEAPLAPNQLLQVIALVYGIPPSELPHPDLDWGAFVKALDAIQKKDRGATVWDPLRNRNVLWFDKHRLARAHGKGCAIM